ncbi:MAG: DUF1634 domain-containing protein [Thermoplasmata archaeon]|nr:DUF1634 domain-containing protein [Thermoplasmata archaeon]
MKMKQENLPEISPTLRKILYILVIITILLFLVGIASMLLSSAEGSLSTPMSFQSLLDSILKIRPEGIIGLGIFIIIITPIIRLLTICVYSYIRREKIGMIATALSLAAIVISIALQSIS